MPTRERIPGESITILNDDVSNDGVRVIRLQYKMDPPSRHGGFGPGMYDEDPEAAEARKVDAYISLVFDLAGKLVDLHKDEPQISSMF